MRWKKRRAPGEGRAPGSKTDHVGTARGCPGDAEAGWAALPGTNPVPVSIELSFVACATDLTAQPGTWHSDRNPFGLEVADSAIGEDVP